MTNTMITWQLDEDGVVVLTMDDPTSSANTFSRDFVAEFERTIQQLEEEQSSLAGVVLTSAKKTFFAGANLNELITLTRDETDEFSDYLTTIKSLLRRLETLTCPVVAAIDGAALGGGFELALATHYRIASESPQVKIGLPEVGLGLLPALGGITRMVRHLGVTAALDQVLLPGRAFGPADARALGLIDEVVREPEGLLPAAKSWIAGKPEPKQPWDRAGFQIPGGTPTSGPLMSKLGLLSAGLRAKTNGAPAPAERAILATAVEGAGLDFEGASLVETRYFLELAVSQIAKNKVNLTFFDIQRIKSGASRPPGEPQFRASRVGVIGAGMMGAGIAYSAARVGITVVLVDVTIEGAERGKAYSEKIEAKAVAAGKRTDAEAAELLARITPSASIDDLSDVDFVIEAVFENQNLKSEVFERVSKIANEYAVLGSNTSTLPISSLASSVPRPEDFVGVHFFSPVDKMQLVEIIRGEKTSDQTIAEAFDLVRQLNKTPIVVNDSRGFFTSRVIIARLNEAIAMLGEGIAPASIEQASLQAGYPAGALQLLDELTLTLPRAIREEARAAAEADGVPWVSHPAHSVFDALVDDHGRTGRVSGSGLYTYQDGRRVGLWPGIAEAFPPAATQPPLNDLIERLLFAEALEAWHAHEGGVITEPADANVGSLLGIGFPAWTGGALRYIDQYEGGRAGFAARATELATKYGDRFQPPASWDQGN